ncbi:uncharacterized protein DDB_G0271670 [Durio zibethinus]|uniref:Uncharacterized protein DDB_G0271670 n=1 Tax=Durio zibethinus TaxID=66656 RepID=A0A6P6BFP6_DURZI|nr:uncharacterized protein DDB_G0271670 [Durio zibethinus]
MEESYGSDSSKYSSRHQELDAETGSSRHSSGESGGSKYSVTYNPEIHKGWGNNNNFEIHPVVFDESESSKRSEVIQEEMDGIEGEKMRLSMSSSSSSGSSADDQFQEDIKPSKSRSVITSTSSSKPDEGTQQSFKDKHQVSCNNNSSTLEECQNGFAGSTSKSQVSSVTHESTSTQSPPIQVMDRLGEFDPYRIPSAVFARSKVTTPMDWSIASNESLFSIQVGNNSFSRDHFPKLKSGELFKSGEFMGLSPSPVALAVDANKKFVNIDKREATVVSDDAVKDKTGTTTEEPIEEKPTHPVVSWNSSTISNHSDDSGTSGRSFAFPVRKKKNKKKKKKQKKCAWSSCYCSDFRKMEEMFLRKTKQSSSNNKNSPWPLQYPQNQLAVTVGHVFLPVDGNGIGIVVVAAVVVVIVVEETAVEELSSRTLPAKKAITMTSA